MARNRIGVWFIGAKGGVASTATVGLLALKKGLIDATALASELPEFKGLDLVDFKDVVIGGHEIRDLRSFDGRQFSEHLRAVGGGDGLDRVREVAV